MGWNDRLPEDPYIAWESTKDADDYEAWQTYISTVEAAAAEAEQEEKVTQALLSKLKSKVAKRRTKIN